MEETVCDRFEAIARRFPDELAIGDSDRSFTYAELQAFVRRVAAGTVAAVSTNPGPVAVLLRHDSRCAAAILGVLAAGRGCIPLDAEHPIKRNALIASRASAAAVIAVGEVASDARQLFARDLPVLDVDRMAAPPSSWRRPSVGPEDLACIIYTSGSSGVPKGVCQDHRGLMYESMQSLEILRPAGIGSGARLALFYSASVIAGLRHMFDGLLSGASIRVLPPAQLGPVGLLRELRALQPTVLTASPTLFRYVAEAFDTGERLDSVRLVALGGERVEWADVDLVRRSVPAAARLIVHLGATEIWAGHTVWEVDELVRSNGSRLPVGYPLSDRTVSVVGEDSLPVADGEIGECVVKSRYVALGYWRDAELTARAFSTDPSDPTLRVYRTGDLVLRRPDGLLEHVGRKDHQIKISGRRVEIGEIESALKQCVGIKDAAIVIRRTEGGDVRSLVAYAELRTGFEGLVSDDVRTLLSERLPRHMVPAAVLILPALPRLPTFKIDRSALAVLDAAGIQGLPSGDRRGAEVGDSGGDSAQRSDANDTLGAAGTRGSATAPADGRDSLSIGDIQHHVADAFRAVFPGRDIGLDTDFFVLGGDSMKAMTLLSTLGTRFGTQASPDTLFRCPTPRTLARALGRESDTALQGNGGLVALNRGSHGCPVFLVPAIHPTPWVYQPLVDVLGLTQPVYGLRCPDIDWPRDVMNMAEMIAHYVTAIRQACPRGPYAIVGHSFGGHLAFEIANRIATDGQEVRHLVMLDAKGPYRLSDRLARPFAGRQFREWLLSLLIQKGVVGMKGLQRLGLRRPRHRAHLSFGEGPLTPAELRRTIKVTCPEIDPQAKLSFEEMCAALIAYLRSSMTQAEWEGALIRTPTPSADPAEIVKALKVMRKNNLMALKFRTGSVFDGTITLVLQTENNGALRWQQHATKPLNVIRAPIAAVDRFTAHGAFFLRPNIDLYAGRLRELLTS